MNDNEISYRAAVRYAKRHIQYCCKGRPCLEDCLRRLGGSLPPCACAGGWRPPSWAKWLALAAVLAVVLFASLRSNAADVQCIWNGSTYVCSGTGSSIEVIGGGGGGPVTVTNVWGVCTNCVHMTPSQCESLKDDLFTSLDQARRSFDDVREYSRDLLDYVQADLDDISTFQRFGFQTSTSVISLWPVFTNYLHSADNTQTRLALDFPGNNSQNGRIQRVAYNDGIYDYAQTLIPAFERNKSVLQNVNYLADDMKDRMDEMSYDLNNRIDCSQCEAGDGNDPPGGGSGGGSGIATNGNWCTFDQGEAIKDLLRDLKTWADRQYSQLSAISNYVYASYETLRSGLYSDYTSIPRGEDWRNLYLSGQPTGWGYDPTNIIQRIEVLLYGISGISTNTASLEDTTPSAEQTVDDVSSAVDSIFTDADGTAATTLGNAVLDFFRAFTPRTKIYQGGEEIIAEVAIKVGEDTHYVPAMRLGESGFLVDTMTAVKSCVNGLCCVLFWVGGAFVVFRFWAWFAAWCVKLSKWAVELCTSLFAS